MDHGRRDHYSVLGIPRTATPETIRAAFRQHVKRTHPDRDPSPQAAQRFMEVHRAYEVLRDPLQRLAYDARFRPEPPRRPREQPTYAQREAAPDMQVRSWSFIGLHLTGLVFGIVLIIGLLLGVLLADWPWYGLPFVGFGLIIIPDAWRGLRKGKAKGPA